VFSHIEDFCVDIWVCCKAGQSWTISSPWLYWFCSIIY